MALGRDVTRRSVPRHTLLIATPPETDVVTITVERGSHIEVTFADGKVCRFALYELRLACPCAACGFMRDRGRVPWPPEGQPEAELRIADANLVGAYGLGVAWSDGHSTGIYAFNTLRQWCEGGHVGSTG